LQRFPLDEEGFFMSVTITLRDELADRLAGKRRPAGFDRGMRDTNPGRGGGRQWGEMAWFKLNSGVWL